MLVDSRDHGQDSRIVEQKRWTRCSNGLLQWSALLLPSKCSPIGVNYLYINIIYIYMYGVYVCVCVTMFVIDPDVRITKFLIAVIDWSRPPMLHRTMGQGVKKLTEFSASWARHVQEDTLWPVPRVRKTYGRNWKNILLLFKGNSKDPR